MFERFTEKAINVVIEAQRLAKETACSEVFPEHLLLSTAVNLEKIPSTEKQ